MTTSSLVTHSSFNPYSHSCRENYALPTDFKSTILKTVMSQVPVTEDLKADWEWVWGKYQTSPSAAEQQVLYYALGLIQDNATLVK